MHHKQTTPGFTDAIYLAFSAEALQNTQNKGYPALGEFPICIPSKRIRFDGHCKKISPSHSNVIAYIPGARDNTKVFRKVFSSLGTVIIPSKEVLYD